MRQDNLINAGMAFDLGNYDQALAFSLAALEEDACSVPAHVTAGRACLALGDLKQAESHLAEAVHLEPGQGEHRFRLGSCYYAAGSFVKAMEAFAEATRMGCADKQMQEIWYFMGAIHQRYYHNPKAALACYARAEEIPLPNGNRQNLLMGSIQAWLDCGDLEQAEVCAIQLTHFRPDFLQGYQLLFRILLQRRRPDRAEQVLRDAEKCPGLSATERSALGVERALLECVKVECCGKDLKEGYERAIIRLEQLSHDNTVPLEIAVEATAAIAELLQKLGRQDEAVRRARLVAGMQQESVRDYADRARIVLVQIHMERGEYLECCHYAAELKNSHTLICRHYGYYAHACAAWKQEGMTDAVQELYTRAVAYYRGCMMGAVPDLMACVYRARCYIDMEDYDRAMDMVRILPKEAAESVLSQLEQAKNRRGGM